MNVPLAAEPIFYLGPLTITNSLINAWIVTAILIIGVIVLRRRITLVPRGLQNAAEGFLEFLLEQMDAVTHSRTRSTQFLPIIATLFIFILLNNWLGQLPGTGTFGIWEQVHGQIELVPLLRPATSDLNLTLALGLFAIITTHIVGLVSIGVFKHVGKFIQLGGLVSGFKKGPIGALTSIINVGVGAIESVGEVAKVISLSLRLFGNIFAGEVLITVMLSLAAYIIPLPFQALELLVGVIQATVFAMLTLVFLTLATEPPHGDHSDEHKPAHG